ncbi:siderophore-iron reductase FhuF [Methylobacterium mesophilicum SR1.6/6]|uniref:Siderophore-iron reductase FhuF n=1 Tax=Methylobacterium mesophilicum SR1.6/6 TaxID=908290 RepID=A0A6B9FR96_9HYPH|nr:siderophore-iron reductase FhuF [Methylobacterium mesophilicum]QGY03495.1 siderophore-iron reductase FhuF [Methylobacterium mesophilicum SR1.6/6]
MIADLAAQVPASLAAYRDGVAEGPGGPEALPLGALRDPDVFDATLAAFGAGFGASFEAADPRVRVSYWSQFYLAALATPALTALVRLGRPLPLAFDAVSLELDAAGRPCRFRLPAHGSGCAACPAPGLTGLVEAHLRPFVELCHARCGIAPRVLWGNAAVILDYVARELGGPPGAPLGDGEGAGAAPARGGACASACAAACAAACDDVAACLGWRAGPGCARSPLKNPLDSPLARALCPGASGCRRRRVCCLRHRLPGVPSCGALCPVEGAAPR